MSENSHTNLKAHTNHWFNSFICSIIRKRIFFYFPFICRRQLHSIYYLTDTVLSHSYRLMKGKRKKNINQTKILKAIPLTSWYFPVNKNRIYIGLAKFNLHFRRESIRSSHFPLQRFSPENSSISNGLVILDNEILFWSEFIYSQGVLKWRQTYVSLICSSQTESVYIMSFYSLRFSNSIKSTCLEMIEEHPIFRCSSSNLRPRETMQNPQKIKLGAFYVTLDQMPFVTVKVMKGQERLRNCHRLEETKKS